MNILFIDTESTGKPTNYKAHYTDVECWPRCIQLAFEIADEKGNLLSSYSTLIYPSGWVVPKEEFFILHDLSTERCEAAGIKIETALEFLVGQIRSFDVQICVAHNIAFDYAVIAAEMTRCGKKADRKLERICTMEHGVNVCKIPFGADHRQWKNAQRGYKWPKLSELYQKLFDKEMEGGHDALVDVKACRECFFELVRRGVVSLPKLATT